MEETYLLHHPGVKKKILHGGLGLMPHFPPGTKLVFHFQTTKDDFEKTVIDDSRRGKRPMEIFVGKMFKMEVWEVLLTSMRVGEVAEFWCDAIHTGLYPMVSKGMRHIAQGKDPLEGQKHTCGMGNMFYYNCSGFPELDELMKEPQPLIFIMELLSVGDPFSYKRESWMMGKDEKLQVVPSLHLQGNTLVKQGHFCEAASKYQEAVVLLRTVQSREMPGDEVHVNLERLIVPLVLNYCQCMLELQEFYEVLEHTTELLEKHKDNVKAYYKRAKAHAAVWNETEARQDFLTVARLDVTLAALVQRELRHLADRMREKHLEEKKSYWAILQDKGGQTSLRADGGKGKATAPEEGAGGTSHGPGEEETPESKTGQSGNQEAAGKRGERQETRRGASARTEGKDWQQMLRLVPLLQDEGNFLVKELRYLEAAEKYQEAIEYIRSLQDTLDVDHNKEDWDSLEKLHLPLSLNLSQCMLELGEYQQVLEANKKLLRKHRGNLKAMYQSARAHAALHQEDEARKSFAHIAKLDPKFKPIACMELKKMRENIRAKHVQEKRSYWAVAEERWGRGGPGKNGEAAQRGKEAGALRGDRVQLVRTTKNRESKDGQETTKTTKSLPGPSVQMASKSQGTVDHSVEIASENQRTVDPNVEIASENQRIVDPNVEIASENQRIVDPNVEIASENQRIVDPNVEIASENQRIVDPNVEIAPEN
ncbi:aryl-hydrocarbon-interacting protein-like 1 [Brienomyrus brachyistius]|uniref:aryl-hydrocarbon-interacting protein-like 1 n=1 Tax=Brienomyrus brachyistius TaxID=42636 RepID=UPI0020B21481|nr:aryl-hydrocarbon-interacting protein-like 1 [Brienomyrus brachyistius]